MPPDERTLAGGFLCLEEIMGLTLTAANARARLDGGAIPACKKCGERIPAADIGAHSSVCDGRGSSAREDARYQMPMNAVIAAVRGALMRGGARTAIDTSAAAALLTDADGAAIAAALEDAGADVDDVEIWEWQRMDADGFGRGLVFGARSGGENPYRAGARLCGYCGARYHGGAFCDSPSPADMDGADIIIGADGAGISDDDVIIVSGAILVCAVCGMAGAKIAGACEGGYEHTWALAGGGEVDEVELLPGDAGARSGGAAGENLDAMRHGISQNGYAAAVIDMARGLGLSHADALSAAQSGQMERRADGARSGGAKVGAMRHMEFEDGGDWESMKRRERERAALSQREGEGGEISVTIRGDGRAFCDCGAEIDWEMDSIERGGFAFRAFGICRGEVRHGRVLAHDDEIEPNTPYVWDFLKFVTLEEYRDGLT